MSEDVDVDRLTKVQIELMCESAIGLDSNKTERLWTRGKAEALRDLALQSLSQESVRDEALEPLADNERNADIEDFRKAVTYFRMTGKVPQGYSQAVFTEQVGDFALRYIRAVLKREPNAALGMEHPNDAGAGPAPAAPNVASMVKDYPNLYMMLHGAVSGHYTEWALMRKELTALLTRLGQEWIPPTEQQEAEDMRDILERQRKRNRLGASDE